MMRLPLANLWSKHRQLQKIPGPRDFGSFLNFYRNMQWDPMTYTSLLVRTYGDWVRLPFPLAPMVLVADPDLFHTVIQATEQSTKKSLGYHAMELVWGGSWRAPQSLSAHSQERPRVAYDRVLEVMGPRLLREVRDIVQQLAQRCQSEIELEISSILKEAVWILLGKVLFSLETDEAWQPLRTALECLQKAFPSLFYGLAPLPLSLPHSRDQNAQDALSLIEAFIARQILERRHAPETNRDFLSLVMDIRDKETGRILSESQLCEEVLACLLEIQGALPALVSLCCEHLARDADAAELLWLEVKDRPLEDPSELQELNFAQQVYAETLRLYPVVWSMGRVLSDDLEWKGTLFPAGTLMMLSPYHVHRNQRLWEDPERFLPQRFEGISESSESWQAYLPFGVGTRTHLSTDLMQLMALMFMALFHKNFTIEPVAHSLYRLRPKLSLGIEPGVYLKFIKKCSRD